MLLLISVATGIVSGSHWKILCILSGTKVSENRCFKLCHCTVSVLRSVPVLSLCSSRRYGCRTAVASRHVLCLLHFECVCSTLWMHLEPGSMKTLISRQLLKLLIHKIGSDVTDYYRSLVFSYFFCILVYFMHFSMTRMIPNGYASCTFSLCYMPNTCCVDEVCVFANQSALWTTNWLLCVAESNFQDIKTCFYAPCYKEPFFNVIFCIMTRRNSFCFDFTQLGHLVTCFVITVGPL